MSEFEKLKEELFNKKKNGWETITEEEKKNIYIFSEEYINYLNKSKTEREAVEFSKEILDKNGFEDITKKQKINSGDKIYYINRDKNIYAAIIGQRPLEAGINIIGAHLDSPRIDLKPNPLYEDSNLAFLKTHYYGGIKKYQWTTIPLSIHGVVVKPDGQKIKINIGEEQSEPIFTITDLLPHLAKDQMEKKLREAIERRKFKFTYRKYSLW